MTELEELAGILVYPVRFVDRDGGTRVGEMWLDDAQKLAQAILGAGYHKSTSQNLCGKLFWHEDGFLTPQVCDKCREDQIKEIE